MELSFFILEAELDDSLRESLLGHAELKKIKAKVVCSGEDFLHVLPEGHDGYILHLSQTNERAIHNLREAQPWGKIYGISGASPMPEKLVQLVDKTYYIIKPEYFDIILEETSLKYKKS